MFTKYTDAQLGRAVHIKKFIADYNSLVSAQNPANQSSSAWVAHMVQWLKKDPSTFTKRPMQEYLEDDQAASSKNLKGVQIFSKGYYISYATFQQPRKIQVIDFK